VIAEGFAPFGQPGMSSREGFLKGEPLSAV